MHEAEDHLHHPKIKKTLPKFFRLVDTQGIIIKCNKAYAKKINCTIEQATGVHFDEHTSPAARAKMRKEFEEWRQTKKPTMTTTQILSKNGRVTDMIMSVSNHTDDAGNITAMATILMSTQEMKKLQDLVKIRKYESLYENSPDLYRTVNYNGTIIDCNKTYLKTLGYDSKDEVLGRNLLDHTSDKSKETLSRHMAEWRSTGKNKTSEIWMRRKDGTDFPVIFSPTNIYDDYGNLIGRNVVIHDSTELHDTKDMLDEYEKIDRMKEEFLSVVTHELKSPLTPIIGFAQALVRPNLLGDLNDKQSDAVNTILSNAHRLRKLIVDMLDAHKLELEKMRFELGEISVNDLLENIDKSFQITSKEKGITIQCGTKDNKEINIVSDKDRLVQVITNLIYNAIDFVPKDSGKIIVSAENTGQKVTFSVIDNGIGISPQKQQKLFTKFYQADTSHVRQHGGTGLGLAICKGILDNLGGEIGVESTEGKGSKFYFILPMDNSHNEDFTD